MLTPEEVAVRLRVSKSAIYSLIRSELLPSVRIGRRIRIAERVVQNFIEVGGRGWPGGWRKRPAVGR